VVVAGRGNGFSSFQSPPAMIAVAEPAAQAAVPVVAVPVEAVPVVAVPVVAAAEAAVPVVAAAELMVDAAGGTALPLLQGSEYAAAADTGLGTRDERQLERYRRLRDESLRGPDISLEAVGHQRAGHVPYGNLSKTAQRNYIAALQEKQLLDQERTKKKI
jgi:hypothetical protein